MKMQSGKLEVNEFEIREAMIDSSRQVQPDGKI